MKIRPSAYAKRLFTEDFYEADIFGGRGGGGSHNMSIKTVYDMVRLPYFRGFLLRYYQSQVRGSLWQDFKDRIEEISDLNRYDYFKDFHIVDNEMTAYHKPTGNKLVSKGFKGSSNSKSANLKSLAGATNVYIEETEEVGEEEYNKLADSLRTNKALTFDKQLNNLKTKLYLPENKVVFEKHKIDYDLILNEDFNTTIEYLKKNISFVDEKKFIGELGISLVQIVRSWNVPSKEHWLVRDNYNLIKTKYEGWHLLEPKNRKGHLSIFRTYKDNIKNLDLNTVSKFKRYEETSPRYYYSQILGLCGDGNDRKVYYNWRNVSLEEFNDIDGVEAYGVDFGDTAPTTLVHVKYKDGCFYRRELLYKPLRVLNQQYQEELKEVRENISDYPNEDQYNIWSKHKGLLSYYFDEIGVDKNINMFCDPAQKGLIIELRQAGYNAIGAKKDKAANINFINRAVNYYTNDSLNLEQEYQNYYLETDVNKNPIDGKPKKGNDHAIEAAEYACRGLKDEYGIIL